MSKETINRLRNVYENGSRAETPEVEGNSPTHSNEEVLLTAVVILVIIVLALILIIIYGYCKYVKGEMEGRREKRNDVRESTGDDVRQLEPVPEVPEIPQEPVKSRKRSMTFTQNDEECRKYREDLADAYDNERSRKKSIVTFVDVE